SFGRTRSRRQIVDRSSAVRSGTSARSREDCEAAARGWRRVKTTLADFVGPKTRFGRSANIERDRGPDAIDGYVPTGRALDVIARIARGLSEAAAGRAFSITGPHGSGKSSLAVFLDGLVAGSSTREFKAAHEILKSVDPELDAELRASIRSLKCSRAGFFRA